MKENKKIRLSTVLFFVAIIVIIILSICILKSNKKIEEYANSYLRAMEALTNMTSEGRYPDTFYATIEEISDTETSKDVKLIKVKGLDINEARYRNEFEIEIPLTNVGNNIKIQHAGNDISFEDLKIGHLIAVYDYSFKQNFEEDNNNLISVYKIVVLDDNI